VATLHAQAEDFALKLARDQRWPRGAKRLLREAMLEASPLRTAFLLTTIVPVLGSDDAACRCGLVAAGPAGSRLVHRP